MHACVYVCRGPTGEPLYFVTLFPASNQGIGVKNNNNNKMTERQGTLFMLILVICSIVKLRAGVSEMTI